MTAERKNEARTFDYLDPMEVLTDLSVLRAAVEKFAKGLSDNDRKNLVEEMVQAAVFCAGMAQLWKRTVLFSPGERSGSDSLIAISDQSEGGLLAQLQLKQLHPHPQSTATLQSLIDGLVGKYSGMYVGIAVNRPGEIDFESIVPPPSLKGEILELWIFGRHAGDDRSKWFFYGDILGDDPRTWPLTISDALPLGDP